MKKSIIKYMSIDMRNSVLVYTAVIILVSSLVSAAGASSQSASFSGIGFSAIVFMFVAAMATLPAGIKYMNQSGFSRKTAYVNYVAVFSATSLLTCVLTQVLIFFTDFFLPTGVNFLTEYNTLYGGTPGDSFFQSILWLFCAVIAFTAVAFFISLLYQRMGPKTTVYVSVGFPVFFTILLPLIDSRLFGGVVYNAIGKALLFVLGIYNDVTNPMVSIGMLMAIAAVFFSTTYIFLVRRLNFK